MVGSDLGAFDNADALNEHARLTRLLQTASAGGGDTDVHRWKLCSIYDAAVRNSSGDEIEEFEMWEPQRS